VSNRDSVELFESGPCRGASFEDVAAAVAALPAPADAPAEGVVLDPAGIRAWLLEQAGRELILSYGDEPYRAAAESAAAWLRERFGVGATATAADGGWLVEPPEGKCTVQFQPTPATVLIGNEWSNNMIAMLSSTWPFNNEKAPAMMSGRLSATHAWPPAGRGIVALTRAVEFRRENHTCWGISWNNHDGYAPRLVEAAPEPFQHRKLLILAATPQGAERAVQELMRTVNP